LSLRLGNLDDVLLVLDLDGVLADIGPGVADRVAARFEVDCHPATWLSYDLRHLGLPEPAFRSFLDETFADPALYELAAPCDGALYATGQLTAAGWQLVAVTARSPHLVDVTRAWLDHHGLPVDEVHHVPFGSKWRVARRLRADAAIEDNAEEAESLAAVCESWLLDRPYNTAAALSRSRRLRSWDDAVGRLCQLRLFAS
jgi:uncharacterized HAD superfamily protein